MWRVTVSVRAVVYDTHGERYIDEPVTNGSPTYLPTLFDESREERDPEVRTVPPS